MDAKASKLFEGVSDLLIWYPRWGSCTCAMRLIVTDRSKALCVASPRWSAARKWRLQGLQAAEAPYVFPSRGTSLTARQMRNRMAYYLKLAGITKAYSPHSLRHYAVHQLMPSTQVHLTRNTHDMWYHVVESTLDSSA